MAIISPSDPNKILVINDKNQLFSVTPEHADELQEKGYSVATPEQIDALKEKKAEKEFMESTESKIATTTMGLASGASFGLAPYLVGKAIGAVSGKESEDLFKDWLSKQEEYNPGLKLGSELAGGFITPGAAGSAFKAADTAMAKAAVKFGATKTAPAAANIGGKILDELSTVTRYGGTGGALESGQFVMRGEDTWLNYLKSGKWQPGKEYASKKTGIEYKVPSKHLEEVKEGVFSSAIKNSLLDQAVYNKAANTTKKSASRLLGDAIKNNAAQGALAGFGYSLSRQYIEDNAEEYGDISASQLFSDAVTGALVGAAVPVAFEGGVKVLDTVKSKLVDPMAKAVYGFGKNQFKKAYTQLSSFRTGASVDDIKRIIADTKGEEAQVLDAIIKDLLEIDAPPPKFDLLDTDVNADISISKRLAALKQARKEAMADINSVYKQTNIANLSASDINKIKKAYSNNLSKQKIYVDSHIQEIEKMMQEHAIVDGVGKTAEVLAPYNEKIMDYKLALEKLEKAVSNSDDGNLIDFMLNKGNMDYGKYESIIDDFYTARDNLMAIPTDDLLFGTSPHAINMLSKEQNALENILIKRKIWDNIPDNTKREFGLLELLGGGSFLSEGIGLGPIGKAFAAAKLLAVGKDPARDINQWASLKKAAAKINSDIELAGKYLVMPYARRALEHPAVVRPIVKNIGTEEIAKTYLKIKQDDDEHSDLIKSMQSIKQNPSIVEDEIMNHLSHFASTPETRLATAKAIMRASNYLISIVPTLRPYDGVEPDKLMLPSKDEIRAFKRALGAIKNPSKSIQNIGLGTISDEEIRALKYSYPPIYNKIILMIQGAISSGIATRQARALAERILEINSEGALYQEALGAPLKEEPKRTSGRKQPQGAVDRQVEANKTATQKIQK